MYGNPPRNVWRLADPATHAGIRRTDLKVAPAELLAQLKLSLGGTAASGLSTIRPPALNVWPAFIPPPPPPEGGRY